MHYIFRAIDGRPGYYIAATFTTGDVIPFWQAECQNYYRQHITDRFENLPLPSEFDAPRLGVA